MKDRARKTAEGKQGHRVKAKRHIRQGEKKRKDKTHRDNCSFLLLSLSHCYEREGERERGVPRELANVFYSLHTFFYSLCGQEKRREEERRICNLICVPCRRLASRRGHRKKVLLVAVERGREKTGKTIIKANCWRQFVLAPEVIEEAKRKKKSLRLILPHTGRQF